MTNQVQSFEFFATCLPGAEKLLADELHGLGVKKVRPLSGGASFFGARRRPAGVPVVAARGAR